MRENKEKQEHRKKREEEKAKRRAGEKGEIASVKEKSGSIDEEPREERDIEKGESSVEIKS